LNVCKQQIPGDQMPKPQMSKNFSKIPFSSSPASLGIQNSNGNQNSERVNQTLGQQKKKITTIRKQMITVYVAPDEISTVYSPVVSMQQPELHLQQK